MTFSEAIDIVHRNLTDGLICPFYFRTDTAPVASLKYENPNNKLEVISVLPNISVNRIVWSGYSKSTGVIIEHRSGTKWYYGTGKVVNVPKLDATNDSWFNFTVLHGLTKSTYQKYLEILKHAELLNDAESNVW